jgi:hypothetical protein
MLCVLENEEDKTARVNIQLVDPLPQQQERKEKEVKNSQ